jgi:hypothetical protein
MTAAVGLPRSFNWQRLARPMVTQLKFLGIPARDQDRTLIFYTEKLGFEFQLTRSSMKSSVG